MYSTNLTQDPLTLSQVVQILKDAFHGAGLPLHVVPYCVIPSRTGVDNAPGGIIQVSAIHVFLSCVFIILTYPLSCVRYYLP